MCLVRSTHAVAVAVAGQAWRSAAVKHQRRPRSGGSAPGTLGPWRSLAGECRQVVTAGARVSPFAVDAGAGPARPPGNPPGAPRPRRQ